MSSGQRHSGLTALGRTRAGVFVVDPSHRIIFWNRGAERLLGHSASEALNRPCHEIVAGWCRGKALCHANCAVQRKLRRGALPPDFDLLTRTRSGREIWVSISILAIPMAGKTLAAHFLRDVTADRRNEATLEAVLAALGGRDTPGRSRQPARRPLTVPGQPGPALQLSRREIEVLTCLGDGDTTQAIAERMSISRLTVRKHVQNVLRRLGLHSKAAAVSFAFRSGLL